MNKMKRQLSKNELLAWANSCIESHGLRHSQVEDFGSGQAYLYILNSLHPGCLTRAKYVKAPRSEYERLNNLKAFVSTLQRLGIQQAVDINKICKMKLQDNLALLQWLHSYTETANRTKGTSFPSHPVAARQNKAVLRPPEKLNLKPSLQSQKRVSEFSDDVSYKAADQNSAKDRLSQIKYILSDENLSCEEKKLTRIKQIILGRCSPAKMRPFGSINTQSNSSGNEVVQSSQNSHLPKEEQCCTKSVTKSRILSENKSEKSLQEHYRELTQDSQSATTNQGVRVEEGNNIIHEYQQERLTDNSILLNASMQSPCTANKSRRSLYSDTENLLRQ